MIVEISNFWLGYAFGFVSMLIIIFLIGLWVGFRGE